MLSILHLDQRGSPVIVTDEGGNVIKRHRYYAFGSLRYQSGTFDTDYSFTGYLKEETGSHYAKMRYYSAGIGRFLRPDPAGGINPYLYCGNNPVNFVDPSGLSSEDAGGWYCWYNYTTGEWVYSGITVTGHYDYSGATNTAYSSYSVMMSQWAYEQLMEEGIGLETPFAGLPAIDDLRYYGGHGGGSGRSSSSSDSEGAGGEGGGGGGGGGVLREVVNGGGGIGIREFDWGAFGHTCVTIGSGALVGTVGDKIFPGAGSKISIALGLASGSEIRSNAMTSQFALGKILFWGFLTVKSGGTGATAFVPQMAGALFVTWYKGRPVYYYYKEANDPVGIIHESSW